MVNSQTCQICGFFHRTPYWYIEAVPELLQLAAERAERTLAKGVAQ
jgi:NMD protein affecting ribosome stability and mRNA decay